MTPSITPPVPGERAASLNAERKRFRSRARHSLVTQQGYAYDWAQFERWCFQEGRVSMPASPDTVADYVADQLASGKKVATARRRWSAIVDAHKTAGMRLTNTEEVGEILAGAQRIRLETPEQMTPLSVIQLEKIVRSLEGINTPFAARARAVMVFGFASALRRSTLSALMLRDVEFTPKGLIVNVRVEKQDQRGAGRMIGLPYGKNPLTCPVTALQTWLRQRGESAGPLFIRLCPAARWGDRLSAPAFGDIIKACVSGIGLDPDLYCGHSLRSGLITAAGEGGASLLLIAAQSGHKSLEVLKRYFRRTELFKSNAASMIGL